MSGSRQPEVNIGMIGHVDHGKTTLTKALTGVWTDRHSEEIKRGISIRLGYADAAFYKCPDCESAAAYTNKPVCPECGGEAVFQRQVSFVDAPGHETLMATMLSGAAMMNGALLLVAANEKCPQPQTKEHLMALSIIGVEKIIIVQNKVDIVTKEEALANYKQIKEFVKGTIAEKAPIVPVSAHHDVNIDKLIEIIQTYIPTPKHEEKKPARLFVARSFDVNQPGSDVSDLKGGVLGGTLISGRLEVGDEIEILPGRKVELPNNKISWETITTKIESLQAGGEELDRVRPGGLIAIGTKLDPSMTKSDGLTGRVVGKPGTLPPVLSKMLMSTHLLERVVGTADDLAVDAIKTNEPLMLSVGTATTVGVVSSARSGDAEVVLKIPVCAEKSQRVAISRKISGKWRLIGYGIIK